MLLKSKIILGAGRNPLVLIGAGYVIGIVFAGFLIYTLLCPYYLSSIPDVEVITTSIEKEVISAKPKEKTPVLKEAIRSISQSEGFGHLLLAIAGGCMFGAGYYFCLLVHQ
jgi:hypothetical protein